MLSLGSVGCVDAEGEYDDFRSRAKETTGIGGTQCADPTAACAPATPGDLSGQWLFALSATISPAKPILFFADIVSSESGGQLSWT